MTIQAALSNALSSLAAVAYFFVVVWETLATDRVPSGYPTIVCLILLLGGLILLTLGIIGEYIGRIFEEVKNRPLYLIAKGKPKDEEEMIER